MASQRQTEATKTIETVTTGTTTPDAGTKAGAENFHGQTSTAPDQPAATAETGQVIDAENVEFTCRTNAIYHAARRRFLDFAHRLTMLVVLLSGSAATVALLSNWPGVGKYIAMVPVVAGALDLVMGFSVRARDHHDLAKRYWRLLAKLQVGAGVAATSASLYAIYADEPPQFRALFAACENQAMDMMARGAGHHYIIPAFQRVLQNVMAFPATRYLTASETT